MVRFSLSISGAVAHVAVGEDAVAFVGEEAAKAGGDAEDWEVVGVPAKACMPRPAQHRGVNRWPNQ